MSVPQKLVLSVEKVTKERLTIKVKNNPVPLEKVVTIELFPPAFLLDNQIIAASRKAKDSENPRGASSLAGVVSGPPNWSVWAKADMSESGVPIMLRNDRDQNNKRLNPPIPVAAGAEFTIDIPLDSSVENYNVEFMYACTHNGENCGSEMLKLKSGTSEWTPHVKLESDQTNPTAIDAKTTVKISWEIKNGISATLRGPLPDGNAEWRLSDSGEDHKMSGEFPILAVGPVTYLLQAEVEGPKDKPNVQVVRMLSLDVKSFAKYGHIQVRPDRLLPFGPLEIDWAAWGVDEIVIDAGSTGFLFPLTDMTLSNKRQGIGIMRTNAGAADPDRASPDKADTYKEVTEKKVSIRAQVAGEFASLSSTYTVVTWRQMKPSIFTGQPVGLAVADGKMALLTTDGLWIATVGADDRAPGSNEFTRPTPADTGVTWRAITAFGNKFIVLRQTRQDVLQVALYSSAGIREGAPIDLPNELWRSLNTGASVFDLAVYEGRVYVVVEGLLRIGLPRRVFSASFDKTPAINPEPLLEHLADYRLLAFDKTLYALNRESGRIFRFTLNVEGRLEPHEAATAIDKGSSMLKQGMFAPVGRVLAVLGPSSVPSTLAAVTLRNVLRYKTLGTLKAGSIPQDLVYNPQQDRWEPSGHGIEIKPGMVCGYRGGTSPRLWMIGPNGDTYTLSVQTEHLFSPKYNSKSAMADLDPYFNETRKFTIVNSTAMNFVPLNDTCFKAGLTALSATAPVEMTPAVFNLGPNSQAEFKLRYNKVDSPTTTLRFLLQRPDGIKIEYFLEVTLSGADLSTATTVFKRIDGYGNKVEVPGTRKQQSSADPIEFVGTPLIKGLTLYMSNFTPYTLWLRSPYAKQESDREKAYNGEGIKINYSSTPISIYAHGAGELFFDVDFAMPHGVREAFENEAQTTCIRVNNKSTGLTIESPNFGETPLGYSYACPIRYRLKQPLHGGVYLTDPVPAKNGDHIYFPLFVDVNFGQVFKYDVNNLYFIAEAHTEGGREVFDISNAVAVSSEKVISFLKDKWVYVYNYDLTGRQGGPWEWHDAITNVKASKTENKYFTLGMKQVSSNPPKYTYRYMKHSLTAYEPEQVMPLDHLKGFRPARVTGAPAWVSPDTISPMDVNGDMMAICVEGGLIYVNTKTKAEMEIKLDGTGREEAVAIDPTESLIFCAHNRMDNQGLTLSRISSASPINRLTIHLPTPVEYMTTDTNTVVGPYLRYHRQRAVSIISTIDKLFVSHGNRIYVLDKWNLSVKTFAVVDLPCRLIQVRPGKPPGENHPKYGAPKDCVFVWAIGAKYKGDGRTRGDSQISLYKVAFLF